MNRPFKAVWLVWWCLCAAGVAVGSVASAQAPDPPASVYDLFARGNQLYEAGEFEDAVDVYEEVASRGAVAPELYYNLANAYYKSGDLGRAVLNYERTLRLAPRQEDAMVNLELVRSMLRDRQFIEQPGLISRTATWLHRRLNARESLALASLLYLALVVLSIVFVFRDTGIVSRVYKRVSLISPGRFLGLDKTQDFTLVMVTLTLLLLAAGASGYKKYREVSSRRAAIVVQEDVPVYSGPNTASTLQFRIHEGTRVSTGDSRPGWVQISLPGDLSGWIVDATVERI